MTNKLYLLIRKDLPRGAQLAQLAHGMRQFSEDQPEVDRAWYKTSNTVAVLHVRDQAHLLDLHDRARDYGIPHAVFREPDMDDQATCLVLGPAPRTKRLTAGLPLAG